MRVKAEQVGRNGFHRLERATIGGRRLGRDRGRILRDRDEHGAPLRLHMPVRLGYKSAKYIYSIRVSNVLGNEKGFWVDQGYSWYGGI